MKRTFRALAAATAVVATGCAGDATPPPVLSGVVTGPGGGPVPGAFVTLRRDSSTIAMSVVADAEGHYRFQDVPEGSYSLAAHGVGAVLSESVRAVLPAEPGAVLDVALDAERSAWADARSPAFLGLLPDGPDKRDFILDCTGCHHFDQRTVGFEDRLKSREEWTPWVEQMIVTNANMSPSRSVEATVDWLVEHLGAAAGDAPRPRVPLAPPVFTEAATRALFTEYDIPVPQDLPHDLMVDIDGTVVVTGQLTGVMFVLDPGSGTFEVVEIPTETHANPRALDIDAEGNWMVSLGAPQSIARRTRATGEWEIWHVGMHPHSVQLDADGDLWYNGHFSIEPERIGVWDAATETVRDIVVPSEPMPDGGITMQYGLRVAPDGTVWTTQLMGGRLIRFDPTGEGFRLYDMPTPASGPRRPDVGPDGIVWVPEYSGGKLARFDPETEEFRELDLPIADALPYVVRVDQARNVVWLGTSAAEAIIRFDPATDQFDVFPLPTRGAMIRHMDIDEASGDVWAAYGAYPSRGVNKILRLQVG